MKKVKEFEDLMNKAVFDSVFPGCNVGIVIKNKDEFKENFYSFGNKALYPKEIKNDIDTIYDMASCSKVLSTTSCLFKLLEGGKVRLYDYVSLYLPDFKNTDITIWDLMTHTSGLPEGLVGAWTMTRDEIYNGIMNIEKKYEKNSGIHYSDVGYLTLGLLIEKVSGMSLDKFAKINIFDPLEMYDTCYNPTNTGRIAPTEERENGKIDLGYVHDEMAHNFGGVAGHAGLFSTVKDISHFIEMVLNDGVYKGKKIFDKKTIDLMYKPQVEEKYGCGIETDRRALGWIVKGKNSSCGDYASDNTILHTGFTGTNVFIDRDNKVGFVMLANRVHPTRKNTLIIPFRSRVANFVMTHLEEFGKEN